MIYVPVRDTTLTVSEVMELHELLARYGHLIDERQFDRLGEVFTDDAVYDASDFGVPIIHGLDEVVTFMAAETRHPLAHHCSNVLIGSKDGAGRLPIVSKGIGVSRDGGVGSVTYVDVAELGPQGWRLRSRRAVLRR